MEHSIDGAVYALAQGGDYEPTLLCSCGFVASGTSWEDAGGAMDDHLGEAERARTSNRPESPKSPPPFPPASEDGGPGKAE